MNEAWHTLMEHGTYERGMAHANEVMATNDAKETHINERKHTLNQEVVNRGSCVEGPDLRALI